jgi:pyruvate/2-oxoglutarate dehydrogenase complex dihydrolipoamide acyltransferase (E2) component
LKITVPENTPATVGTVIAWIGQPGESLSTDSESDKRTKTDSAPDKAGSKSDGRTPAEVTTVHGPPSTVGAGPGFLSPIVRKLAAERHVDLAQVRGTGLNGRITKQDILDYTARNTGARDTGIRGTPRAFPPGKLIPITTIRKQIAERMQQSKATSPHVLTVMEADMSRVAAHRTANKPAFAADGVNLTFTAYFISALAVALKAQPLVNSSWTEQGILLHSEVNIGMATSLGEEGLIVPVLRRADELSLLGIARAVNDLAGRARSRKLRPEEVRDGTFTLTNHGIGGSLFAMPIINQPQCGILGVGAMQKRAVVVTDADGNDSIAIRPMIYLSFVFDHRILDGASADDFLSKVKGALGTWDSR